MSLFFICKCKFIISTMPTERVKYSFLNTRPIAIGLERRVDQGTQLVSNHSMTSLAYDQSKIFRFWGYGSLTEKYGLRQNSVWREVEILSELYKITFKNLLMILLYHKTLKKMCRQCLPGIDLVAPSEEMTKKTLNKRNNFIVF